MVNMPLIKSTYIELPGVKQQKKQPKDSKSIIFYFAYKRLHFDPAKAQVEMK